MAFDGKRRRPSADTQVDSSPRVIDATTGNLTPDSTDIARKQLHEQLRLQARLLDMVGQAVIATDSDGKIIYWNRAAQTLHGWSTAEALGRHVNELPPSATVQQYRETIRPQLLSGDVWSGEVVIQCRDGVPITVMLNAAPILNEYGEYCGLVGVSMDITERKQLEEALQDSEARFRVVFQGAGIGIALVDMRGRCMQSNYALQNVLGYSEEELRGKAFTEFTHPEDAELDRDLYKELVKGKRDNYQMKKRYIRKDGQIVWGRLIVSLVRGVDGEPQYTIGMVEDVTAYKLAEEIRRQHAARLETRHALDLAFLAAQSSAEVVRIALQHIWKLVPCQEVFIALFALNGYEAILLGSSARDEDELKLDRELTDSYSLFTGLLQDSQVTYCWRRCATFRLTFARRCSTTWDSCRRCCGILSVTPLRPAFRFPSSIAS